MKRRFINITPLERIHRIVIGQTTAIVAVIVLVAAHGPLAGLIEGLLLLAVVDLLITGTLGHSGFYRKLEYLRTLRMQGEQPAHRVHLGDRARAAGHARPARARSDCETVARRLTVGPVRTENDVNRDRNQTN